MAKSGYCNICDNIAEEVKKNYANKEIPPIDALIKKLQDVEIENMTNKIRLEALENWASKIAEGMEQMKVLNDVSDPENVREESNLATDESLIKQRRKCKICKETFSKNFELERHMVNTHASEKTHACGICDKTFFLEWRLKKHLGIHQDMSIRICKFFQEGKVCPFDDVGCKFGHKSEEVVTRRKVEVAGNDHEMVEVDNEIIEVEANESREIPKSTNLFRLNDKRGGDIIEDNVKDSEEVVEGDESKNEAVDLTNCDAITTKTHEAAEIVTAESEDDDSDAWFDVSFFDRVNHQKPHNVYPQNPPIVYPQNPHILYPRNPHIVYPQNPHIVYPQNPHIVYPQNQNSWNFFSA